MIFASVGSMLPFDRFVKGVDDWAAQNPQVPVFLQIGDGEYIPQHCEWSRIIPHQDYREKLNACRLFVAHVGMGSILQALEARKQMVLLPRLAELREHTTDHQLHTAARFQDRAGLLIVDDVPAMQAAMSRLLETPLTPSEGIPPYAQQQLIDKVTEFLSAGRSAR